MLGSAGLERASKEAAAVLARGGLVLYPTDTLYGLAVDPSDVEALERLYGVKGRDPQKPVSVIVPTPEAADSLAMLTHEARSLAERIFPGALTIAYREGRLARASGSGYPMTRSVSRSRRRLAVRTRRPRRTARGCRHSQPSMPYSRSSAPALTASTS